MSGQLAIVLLLLASAVAMFAINTPRMDAVALIMMTALPFTGVVSMGEALSGFSDSNIVLIAALFVLGDGLVRTGVAQRLGDWLMRRAGSSETRLLVLLMMVVAALGAVMSSTGVVAIFIPIVIRICQNTGTPPSQLMMPLSFAALISGMTTLVATAPNLVVNSELVRAGAGGFHFFSFTPFGVPILILGILYMIFARRWLAGRAADGGKNAAARPSLRDWIEQYNLADRAHRVRVTDGSPLVDKVIKDLDLRRAQGASILAIERKGSSELIAPLPTTKLQADDILLIDLFAPDADAAAARRRFALQELPLTGPYFTDLAQDIGMAEVVLPAELRMIGKTVVEFRVSLEIRADGGGHPSRPVRSRAASRA